MRDSNGIGTEQTFASGTAQTTCSMMTLASASLIIPAALYNVLNHSDSQEKQDSILTLSRGTSVILLILYCAYLFFVLRTHKELFEPEAQAVGDIVTEPEEEPILSPWSAALVLIATTVIISYAADYMVDSIDDIAATGAISKTFIGLILIPIVGNAAEHVTACVVAVKNKMDLAMGVAIGSSIQIALLVTPSLVLLGWAIGQPMTLHFETFETIAFALSVMVVTYTVQDGRSNYLEGAMVSFSSFPVRERGGRECSAADFVESRWASQTTYGCCGKGMMLMKVTKTVDGPLRHHRPCLLGQPD